MAGKDLEQMVLDDDTVGQMAEMWFDENTDVFDEAGVDLEDGWTGEPPEELDQVAMDAAVDIVDQLRNPEDGSAGIVVLNEVEQLADLLYFSFASLTANSPEDYEAWLDTLEDEDEAEDADEAEDDLGDVGEPGDAPEVDDEQ